jgi:hypothetical protein
MARSALFFVAAVSLAAGVLGPLSRSALATPLEPTAQELGAFAMARALTLCFSTRMTMGPSRSRALAREILIKAVLNSSRRRRTKRNHSGMMSLEILEHPHPTVIIQLFLMNHNYRFLLKMTKKIYQKKICALKKVIGLISQGKKRHVPILLYLIVP